MNNRQVLATLVVAEGSYEVIKDRVGLAPGANSHIITKKAEEEERRKTKSKFSCCFSQLLCGVAELLRHFLLLTPQSIGQWNQDYTIYL